MPIVFPGGGGGGGGGGSGTVTSVASADTSIAVTNPTTTPSLKLATLDVIAANEPPAAAVALNAKKITGLAVATAATDAASLANTLDQFGPPAANVAFNAKKITGLANGSAATDAAAFGQIPAAPWSQLDYVETTSYTNITATTEATAQTFLATNAITLDGATSILVVMSAPALYNGSVSSNYIVLFEGATVIGTMGAASAAATYIGGYFVTRLATPSAAAHTYTVKAWTTAGTFIITAAGGGTGNYLPAYVQVLRIA